VLSGNRNFDGRIHRLVSASFLTSPALVVAAALVAACAEVGTDPDEAVSIQFTRLPSPSILVGDTLRDLFGNVGRADVIVGYTRDMWKARTWPRAAVSKTFTLLVNAITRRHLRYYNGLQIHPAALLKQLDLKSTGYGFQAEVLAQSLRHSRTFVEVPMTLTERRVGESKAFRVKNVVDVTRTLVRLCGAEWGLLSK